MTGSRVDRLTPSLERKVKAVYAAVSSVTSTCQNAVSSPSDEIVVTGMCDSSTIR
jgi:hypothetical protein